MNSDTIRTIFTYVIALVVIVGGGALLVIPSQVPPEQLLPFETGIIGAVIAYVFNERSTAATLARLSGPATDGTDTTGK